MDSLQAGMYFPPDELGEAHYQRLPSVAIRGKSGPAPLPQRWQHCSGMGGNIQAGMGGNVHSGMGGNIRPEYALGRVPFLFDLGCAKLHIAEETPMVRPKRLSTYAHKTNWMMFVDGENLTLRQPQSIGDQEKTETQNGF
jgi:hypothetical protein